MNETKAVQWTVRAAYAAAVLFAIHLIPSLLFPLWLWLVGRLIAQRERRRLGRAEEGEPSAPALGRGKDR